MCPCVQNQGQGCLVSPRAQWLQQTCFNGMARDAGLHPRWVHHRGPALSLPKRWARDLPLNTMTFSCAPEYALCKLQSSVPKGRIAQGNVAFRGPESDSNFHRAELRNLLAALPRLPTFRCHSSQVSAAGKPPRLSVTAPSRCYFC